MENTDSNELPVIADETTEQPNPEFNSTEFELTEPREIQAKANSHGRKIKVLHILRTGTLPELQARDAARPYRSRDIGNEEEEILADQTGTADIKLYDKLVLETKGYKLNVTHGQEESERKQALKGIPSAHKRSVIKDLTEVDTKPVYDGQAEGIETFEWTENQTYRMRTEIGSRGQFVVYTNIREPSEKQLEFYNGAAKFVLEKGHRKPITKITVDLEPAAKLFDALVSGLEGFVYNGQPVDVTKTEQLASIDGYFKRSVVDAVVKETQLDMGE